MVRRHISTDLKEMALTMSLQGVSDSKIREYTGISGRSHSRFCSEQRRIEAPVPQPLGRPRVLSAIEVKVCMQCPVSRSHLTASTQYLRDTIDRQPDMTLLELQTELREAFHVQTSTQTIARSLQRIGFTMKMVRGRFFQPYQISQHNNRSHVLHSNGMRKIVRCSRPSSLSITAPNNSSLQTRATLTD